MNKNKLQISVIERKDQSLTTSHVTQAARRQEIQATLDRLWKVDPNQFDPNRDYIERKRIEETVKIIQSKIDIAGKNVADVGCGGGELSRKMRDLGAVVDAVDASNLAIAKLKKDSVDQVNAIQDCLPNTFLKSSFYDIVICTEVIGYLKPQEYRIAFSELARILKSDGFLIFSTPLDINSDNALERLTRLAETEFEIDTWMLSYNLLWLRISHFFGTPKLYAEASENTTIRNLELAKRKSIAKRWFLINTHVTTGAFWKLVSFLLKPLNYFIRNNSYFVNALEKISHFLWSDSGMTHALFIGKLRKMTYPLPKSEQPHELKQKRQVWE